MNFYARIRCRPDHTEQVGSGTELLCCCRHVHSYERMNRVYNYTVDPCGPIHVTVGDGGQAPGSDVMMCPMSSWHNFHLPMLLYFVLSRGKSEFDRKGTTMFCALSRCLPAGNIEKLYTDWVDRPTSNCPLEDTADCPTRQQGHFCPQSQPAWSAFRYIVPILPLMFSFLCLS